VTKRLYYENPNLLEFEALIEATGRDNDCWYTVLDRSAFYPTSGGQLHDIGVLNDIELVEVIEDEGGEVRHLSRHKVGEIGAKVTGLINAERRWKHRRMHTAQHIFSQAFIELAEHTTVSVHLGEEYGALELDISKLPEDILGAAERLSNEKIMENLPIEIIFVDADEAARLPLRKLPDRKGRVRIIKTGEFDYSACGGTHCNSSGEIGLLKIIGTEKIRNHILVRFLCGAQALSDYARRYEVTDCLARQLTCNINDLCSRTDQIIEDNKSLRKEIGRLNRELLPTRVEGILQGRFRAGKHDVICSLTDLTDSGEVSPLARTLAERIKGVVMLVNEDRLTVVVTQSSGLHAGNIARAICQATGLKGGGGQFNARIGGALKGQLSQYKDIVIEFLSQL